MEIKTKIKFISASFFLIFLLAPLAVRAEDYFDISVTPSLIDVKCEKREMLEYTIKIKNDSAGRADIYAQINDISPETGMVDYSDPSELDQNASLTRWINFRRAVIKVEPGAEVEEPLKISVSPDAVPGKYHAIITFPPGLTRADAQKTAAEQNEAKLLINLEVATHKVEQAEITEFKPVKSFFLSDQIGFKLKIKNIGNEATSPTGEIVIYSKRGKEAGSLTVAAQSLAPGETKDFSVSEKLNLFPGKYKSKLLLNYGETKRDLSDIVYFSFMPLWLLIVLIFVLLGLIFAATFLFNKKRREGRRETVASPDFQRAIYEPKKTIKTEKPKPKNYVINLKKD